MGDTLASFHSSGKIPVVIDKFIMWVKDGAAIGATSFSKRQDIPSRPQALFNESELISFKTVSMLVSVKVKAYDTGLI